MPSLPAVFNYQPGPFSKRADKTYDMGLGAASVNGVEDTVARPWVEIRPLLDEEDIAKPAGPSLRVPRRVKCVANSADAKEYMITQAGLSGIVKWLMRASDRPQSRGAVSAIQSRGARMDGRAG